MKLDNPLQKKIISFFSYLVFGGSAIRVKIKDAADEIVNDRLKFELKAESILGFQNNDVVAKFSLLFSRAIRYRKQKAIVKSLISGLLIGPLLINIFVFPIIFCYNSTDVFKGKFSLWALLFVACGIGLTILFITSFVLFVEFLNNIQARLTRLGRNSIVFILFGFLHALSWYFLNKHTGDYMTILFLSLLNTTMAIDIALIIFVVSEPLVDLFSFSKKVALTDELILETTYNLATINNWPDKLRKRNQRNDLISEIERLAGLIENDWASHVYTGDVRNEKWKRKTLKGIATGIRKLKRDVILPSDSSIEKLTQTFDSLFSHLLNHNLQGFIQEDLPVERIRKRDILGGVKQFFVAIMPFVSALFMYHFAPTLIPEEYIGLPLIIGSGWLILCLLFWLDPQLGEKISVLKSSKTIFSSKDIDDD